MIAPMSQAQTFLTEIEAFLARTKMPPTSFGTQAVKDPNFVRDLRGGRSPSLETADRVRDFIRSQEADAS